MTVKVGIVSAKDGLINVVNSESNSPPLLGAKAVRVRLSQIYHLLPTRSHSPARRQASGAKNAPAEDVTVAESGASIKEFPVEEPAPSASTLRFEPMRLTPSRFRCVGRRRLDFLNQGVSRGEPGGERLVCCGVQKLAPIS